MSEAADAAMIEAADADGRLCDDPLTDRPVDAAAAAERERSAKAAKLAAQTANAMVAVQGQLKLRGQAADKAAHDANAEAGAPVKASSMMVVERVFAARLDGPDRYMVARRKERKTAAGAGTAVEVVAWLEKMANSAVTMVRREGADGITVTAEHKALLDDVALEQGRKAIVGRSGAILGDGGNNTKQL